MNATLLKEANLGALSGAQALSVPSYPRKDIDTAIVHIGLGHFHRAHQAAYLDELLNRGLCRTGIFELNLIPDSWPLSDTAKAQGYLYTLITRGADGEETVRVIGSILGYLNAADNAEAAASAIERLASEKTKLISLTVTEKGYHYGPDSLDWDAPAIRNDLQNRERPETVMGYLAAALAKRFDNSKQPVTIMSCDNIPHNGKRLKEALLSFCKECYPEMVSLVPWIEDNAAFPNSMVDRITPGTTADIISYLEEKYSLIDKWPIRSEDYCQWVLEENYCPGSLNGDIPDYSAAGVQVVKDVEPYEMMKIRLLNGSHSALSYPGYLLGRRGVAEAILDPSLGTFIRRFYMEEITKTLAPAPGINLDDYKDSLVRRFSNKNIADSVLRLAEDGSKKIPLSILKPLTEAINQGLPRKAIILALAAWARFLGGGVDEAGEKIPLQDPRAQELAPLAGKARENPAAFLYAIGVEGISGSAMAETGALLAAYLSTIYTVGIRKALDGFLAENRGE